MKKYRAIGLMSGTSVDGVDAALLLTDGHDVAEPDGFYFVPYPDALRDKIRALFNKKPDPAVERELTLFQAEAVKALLAKRGLSPSDIDVVGFHGQTISHNPERGETCQMGDGALLAKTVKIDVVNDFRTADVKNGGQGAPLAPVYHNARAANLPRPVAFLNIGGVANVTYVGAKGELHAFDCGPGNALIDDWMREKTGSIQDENGATAQRGTVDKAVLERLLEHPYFAKKPPKSLDRNAFAGASWSHLSVQDGAATLAAFTAEAVKRQAEAFFPATPHRWYVCGGGRHNAYLLSLLRAGLSAPVEPVEALSLDGDATEAEAFAYLAVRSLLGLHLSFPTTTGVRHPMQGGVLHPYIADGE
jgi:anhydro-N-acetylmuramic acid kinase